MARRGRAWRIGARSVRTAIDLGVNHISAYALTVEPTTKMGRQIAAGVLPKPDDDDEAAKYEIADELFSAGRPAMVRDLQLGPPGV